MTCGVEPPIFRLLDAYVGWDAASSEGLDGLDDPAGLRLATVAGDGTAADETELSRRIPPPWLAHGCGPCSWYLLTKAPPRSRLLQLGPCDNVWRPVRPGHCPPDDLVAGVGLASDGRRIAIADQGAGLLRVWDADGGRTAAATPMPRFGPVAIAPWGEIIVAVPGAERMPRFDLGGLPAGDLPQHLPPGTIDRLGFDAHQRLWIAIRRPDGAYALHVAAPGAVFAPATVAELSEAWPPTGITAVAAEGFCLERPGAGGLIEEHCYSWYGRPLPRACITPASVRRFAKQGQLLTKALDSGRPRCRWHRVRLDADLPSGTQIAVTVAVSEDPAPLPQGSNEPAWDGFAAGVPHPDDWQEVPGGARDFLIDRPAGQYLFLRLRLTGDGTATPVVRRARIDFPRSTSLEQLPAIYRADDGGGTFVERFLSLFDAAIEDLDAAIERFPALLDPKGVPDEVLPWLASFLGLAFDPAWDTARRRRLLRLAPELYRKRGTMAGLSQAISAVFDVKPAIEELGGTRMWGALAARARPHPADARLGAVRLFGRGRARLRVGASRLGRARIRSFGNPDADPQNAGAFRFRITVPPAPALTRARLAQLVDSQKPAHTIAGIRIGGSLVVGPFGLVGVDTVLAPLPPAVLGQPSARLSRAAILRPGPRTAGPRFRLGAAAVGLQTSME